MIGRKREQRTGNASRKRSSSAKETACCTEGNVIMKSCNVTCITGMRKPPDEPSGGFLESTTGEVRGFAVPREGVLGI